MTAVADTNEAARASVVAIAVINLKQQSAASYNSSHGGLYNTF